MQDDSGNGGFGAGHGVGAGAELQLPGALTLGGLAAHLDVDKAVAGVEGLQGGGRHEAGPGRGGKCAADLDGEVGVLDVATERKLNVQRCQILEHKMSSTFSSLGEKTPTY